LGLEYWLITRVAGAQWIVLRTLGPGPFAPGDALDFSSTICSHMIRGDGPHISSDVATCSSYASAAIREAHVISSYAGAPLVVDGEVYGVLCAIDPVAKAPGIESHTHLLATSARILSTLLGKQIAADNLTRRVERAEAEALVDELTGLFNRRGWNRLIERESARSQRYGLQASVFLMDVDGLKAVNDTDGHPAGDEALKRVAAAIRGVTRDHDIPARLGGDEFALLAVETSALDAQTLNERLEAAFAAAGVSVSIGRAHCSTHGGLAQATAFADEAMYEHKLHRAAHDRKPTHPAAWFQETV
jgi:diguanylate cyclase (GGDEF)-like protein